MTSNHLLLYRLSELMLQHEQHILPVDLLFDDEQIGDFVKSIQIDSPYQQMLLEWVLTESVREEKLYVGFTVEGYFHFVLGEVIYAKSEGKSAEYLKEIIEHNKLNGAKEGVEQFLMRFSAEKYIQVFYSLAKIMDDLRFLETSTTNLLKYISVGEFINFIIKNSGKKEIKIFKKSVQKLRDLGYNDYVAKFLNELFNRIRVSLVKGEPETNYLCDFLLCYSSYLSLSDLTDLIESSLHFNLDKLKIEKVEFYSNIGFACRLLNRPDESLKYYQYALREVSDDYQGKIKILNRMATLHSEFAIKERDNLEGNLAIERFKEIVEIINNVSHFDPLLKATVYNNYAKAVFTFFMYKWEVKFSIFEIAKMQNESYEIIIKIKGKYSDLAAKILNNQSQFFAMIGDLNKSLELCLKGFNIVKRIYPYLSKDTAIISFNVGNRYEQLTKNLEAKQYYQMTFDINRQMRRLEQNNQMNFAYIRVLNKLNELDLAENIKAQIAGNDL